MNELPQPKVHLFQMEIGYFHAEASFRGRSRQYAKDRVYTRTTGATCEFCKIAIGAHHAWVNVDGIVVRMSPGMIGRGIPANCLPGPMPLKEFAKWVSSYREAWMKAMYEKYDEQDGHYP